MKVTTIIAHHNYLSYLSRAVESAERQTYHNFICVVDDGSEHTIDEIIPHVFDVGEIESIESLPYGEGTVVIGSDKGLVYTGKNKGPSSARNIGIKLTWNHTDYYQILDSDDYMYPHKIERLIQEMDDDVGAVYADYVIINELGCQKPEFKKPYDKILLETECIVHSGSMINKKAFEKCGLYNESLRVCEDYDLWKRISNHFLIKHVPEFLTLVLDHSKNSTNTVSKEIWSESYRKVVDGIYT